MVLKMVSTSVKVYFDGVWNIFDSFVTLLGVLSFAIRYTVPKEDIDFGVNMKMTLPNLSTKHVRRKSIAVIFKQN